MGRVGRPRKIRPPEIGRNEVVIDGVALVPGPRLASGKTKREMVDMTDDELAEAGVIVHNGELYNKAGRAICGANRARGKGVCKSTYLYPNGRCRVHGGTQKTGAEHHRYKHGRYSKVLPHHLLNQYESGLSDGDLLSLRDEVALVDALVMDRIKRLEGDTDKAWMKLGAQYEAARRAATTGDREAMLQRFAAMANTINKGVTETEVKRELLDLIERRRKLVETERRMLADMGLLMTVSELHTVLALILEIITTHVTDTETRVAIGQDIRRFVLARSRGPALTDRGRLEQLRAEVSES